MSRIKSLNISVSDLLYQMSDGVPGATNILGKMLISPEAFAPADPVISILGLDTLEVYGSDIWALGHYVCKDDMTLLNQVLDNHGFGYLTQELLHHHIQNRQPFEKLYSVEEMEEDMFKRNLPILEKELSYQLPPLMSKQPSPSSLLNSTPKHPTDTSPEMNVYDLVGMLKQRGFQLGHEMPCIYGSERVSTQIYYHPEEKMLVNLVVPENRDSKKASLSWFAGNLYTQRDSWEKHFSASGGGFKMNDNGKQVEGVYQYRDIREKLFTWYNNIVTTTKPLPQLFPESSAMSPVRNMFRNVEQKDLAYDCPNILRTTDIWGEFSDIIAFYNMTQIRDEGLNQMLTPIMEAMPKVVEKAIFDLVNGGRFSVSYEAKTASFEWLMEKLGIDSQWFKQHGVDVDLALQPPKNYTLEFAIKDPNGVLANRDRWGNDPRPHYTNVMNDVFKEFRDRTGTDVPGPGSWQITRNGLEFNLTHMMTNMSEEETVQVLQDILQKKGLDATFREKVADVNGLISDAVCECRERACNATKQYVRDLENLFKD